MVFGFASCSNDDDDGGSTDKAPPLDLAGSTYGVSSVQVTETAADGTGTKGTMTMPTATSLRMLANNTTTEDGVKVAVTFDLVVEKSGSEYTNTWNVCTAKIVGEDAPEEALDAVKEDVEIADDAKWAEIAGAFAATITLGAGNTFTFSEDGITDTETGTYTIDEGAQTITATGYDSETDETETTELAYSDGGSTLTMTDTDADAEKGTASTTVVTFTKK